jgi:hypothetical protein
MRCDSILFSSHAITRMFERNLSKDDVVSAIREGETIVDYPDDQPYPSRLVLFTTDGKPVHAVVARDATNYACYVITAYVPSSELWHSDFKTRKQ